MLRKIEPKSSFGIAMGNAINYVGYAKSYVKNVAKDAVKDDNRLVSW